MSHHHTAPFPKFYSAPCTFNSHATSWRGGFACNTRFGSLYDSIQRQPSATYCYSTPDRIVNKCVVGGHGVA